MKSEPCWGLATNLHTQIEGFCEQKKQGTGTLYSETVLCICQPKACQGKYLIV